LEYTQISNFIKIRPVGAELFHARRRTNMTNLLVVLQSFAKAHKNGNISSVGQLFFTYFYTNSPVFQVFQLSAFYTLIFVCILFCMFLCACCSVIFAHLWHSTWYKVSYTTRLHPATTWVQSFVCLFLFHNHSAVRVEMILQKNCTPRVVWQQFYAFQCCNT
jgi:hypothetical protein